MSCQTNNCKNIFAYNLKKCRRFHSLSLKELSKETGVPVTYLDTLENSASETINFEVLVKLSNYFRISIDSFIQNAEMIPPKKEKIKTYF